jgi:hypothetical protein
MKQIIIRIIVALTMCAVASLIGFTQLHSHFQHATGTLRLVLASVLSPLLYSFLVKLTAGWANPLIPGAATRNE